IVEFGGIVEFGRIVKFGGIVKFGRIVKMNHHSIIISNRWKIAIMRQRVLEKLLGLVIVLKIIGCERDVVVIEVEKEDADKFELFELVELFDILIQKFQKCI
ncbi:8211_t:CDS:2, partial [Dentiscutata erythropus]